MNQVYVSIIVPVYQVDRFLRKNLETLIAQRMKDIELILVDDGSTDGSGSICDEFALKDDRIRVIHKKNNGLSSARNVGLKVAKGKYVAFVDSDDWVSDEYVSLMYETCEKYEADICQCGFFEVISDDINIKDTGGHPEIYSSIEYAYAQASLLSWDCVICCNKLYKRSLFDGISFPEGKIHEDEYVTYKVAYKAKRIAVLPTRLYYYRQRAGSIVNQRYSYKRLDAREAYIEREKFYHSIGEARLELTVKAQHLQWLCGQINQFLKLEDRDVQLEKEIINEQKRLDEELASENLIRRDFLRNNYIFPFDLIGTKRNIVLYGGGTVGQQYYLQIRATNYCNINVWVDKDYKRLRKIGIPVQGIEEIRTVQNVSDYYVIALADADLARCVMDTLVVRFNVDKGKIIYCINSVMNITPENNRV